MQYRTSLDWKDPKTQILHEVNLFFTFEPTSKDETLVLDDVRGTVVDANTVPDDVIESFRQDLQNELNEYEEAPHSAAEERLFIQYLEERGIYAV